MLAEVRFYQRAIEAVRQNEALARQLAGAAAARYGGDRGTLFDVTKARAQLAQLRYDRLRFEELRRDAVARFNALLDRDPRAEVPAIAPWPVAEHIPAAETLYEVALRNEPLIRALDARIRSGMARVDAAWGQLFPDVAVSAQYLVNGPARMSDVDGSGEDALGLMVTLRLPLWLGTHAGRIRRTEAELAGTVERKRAHVSDLLAGIEGQLYRLRNAERLMVLYDDVLIPEARKAMADAEAWYRQGTGGFTDFLEARMTLYTLEIGRERAATERVQAEAALERLVGEPLRGLGDKEGGR